MPGGRYSCSATVDQEGVHIAVQRAITGRLPGPPLAVPSDGRLPHRLPLSQATKASGCRPRTASAPDGGSGAKSPQAQSAACTELFLQEKSGARTGSNAKTEVQRAEGPNPFRPSFHSTAARTRCAAAPGQPILPRVKATEAFRRRAAWRRRLLCPRSRATSGGRLFVPSR